MAVRRNHFGREQIVDGHAVLTAQPAESAAQRQARHSGGGIDTQRRGKAMSLHHPINLAQGAAWSDAGRTGCRVHLHVLHQREVDHQAVVAHGIACDVVSTPSDRNQEMLRAAKLDGANDILCGSAAGNDRGFTVDHGIPDLAHVVVAGIVRQKHFPLEVRFEFIDCDFHDFHLAWFNPTNYGGFHAP